jgi:two-component system chemotaxis response regulator CheB
MMEDGNNKRIRVLVVDDSAYNRRTITKILQRSPLIEVVGTAKDGEEAIRFALALKPDLVTLDLEMPKLDGFSFLRFLMARQPTPVLVVSSRTESDSVFKALELGAVDFVSKPTRDISSELENIGGEILGKVLAIKQLRLEKARQQAGFTVSPSVRKVVDQVVAPEPEVREPPLASDVLKVVVIGSSTGGPGALTSIFSTLPSRLPAAYFVAQHMPPGFTRPFAERLNKFTPLDVQEARDRELVRAGRVFVAPGGKNLTMRRRGAEVVTSLTEKTDEDRYVPSVDALLRSAAETYGRNCISVILTGMGDDGRDGVLAVKRRQGVSIAESEETSVIFGMPKKVILTGAVDQVLPLWKISEAIVELFKEEGRAQARGPGESIQGEQDGYA